MNLLPKENIDVLPECPLGPSLMASLTPETTQDGLEGWELRPQWASLCIALRDGTQVSCSRNL